MGGGGAVYCEMMLPGRVEVAVMDVGAVPKKSTHTTAPKRGTLQPALCWALMLDVTVFELSLLLLHYQDKLVLYVTVLPLY
jgi:hypothetical protein